MKKSFYYTLLLVAAILATSCKDSYFNINNDPNNPVTVGNEFILTGGIAGNAYVIGDYYQAIGSFWSQHYAQSSGASQWATWEEFSIDVGDFDRQFTTMYSGSLMDFQVIKQRSQSTSDWSYYQVSTLIQSYGFQELADFYNQIPFSEALLGVSKITPKYENGKDIADSLLRRIDLALSKDLTASTASTIGNNDLVFQGDMTKWVQFGNTLKLKIYLRFVNTDPQKYSSQIQALLTDNNFLTTSATMTAFKAEENGRNPFFETFMDRLNGNIGASKTLVDTLQSAGDNRLNSIFIPPVDKTGNPLPQVGLGQGRYKADQALYATIANLSTPNVNGLSPVYFFSLPEVDFLVAEAELRYGTPANAEINYRQGIEDSYALFNATPQPALYNAGGRWAFNGLESILTQKWIAAANTNAAESFFDFNRTGFPTNFKFSAVSSIGKKYPQRLLFPDSEHKSNPNTPETLPIDVKVWFAK